MSQEESSTNNGGDLRSWAERTQRTIDFIIQQQAQFNADMQRVREEQAEADRKLNERWDRTEESIRALLAIAELHEGEIGALRESQQQTDRQMKETDERINALMLAVEEMINKRRNGGGRAAKKDEPPEDESGEEEKDGDGDL